VEDENATIKNRMRAEINPATGKPLYDMALGFSLLIFYAFAMQCMSTLATTYRETKSWKYPLIQFSYMTALAYLSAFAVYQLLSLTWNRNRRGRQITRALRQNFPIGIIHLCFYIRDFFPYSKYFGRDGDGFSGFGTEKEIHMQIDGHIGKSISMRNQGHAH
jgi:hypothetical protein